MDFEGIEVDFCPGCMGIWFDRGELSGSLSKNAGADDVETSDFFDSNPSKYACPRCSKRLVETPLPELKITVEKCRSCGGLFLDRGEFQRAKRRMKRTKLVVQPAPKADPDPQVTWDGQSDGAMVLQFLTGLPIEIGSPQRLFSPAVTLLILLNLVVFLLAVMMGHGDWVQDLGVVPRQIASGERLWTLLTSLFMHGGVWHLVGNMYFLFVAGDNVEDALGSWLFLLVYLVCGLTASLVDIAVNPDSAIVCIGASGAISGVLGCYVIMFPKQKFLIRWFYFWLAHVCLEWPAYVYFGLWLILQVVYAALGIPGVGWFAHIGGFVAGALVGCIWRLRRKG